MNFVILTAYDGAILGPVAKVLGILMNAIFSFCENLGVANVGLAIILFTIVINCLLLPLTIRQQKFAKMNAVVAPELQKITAKYKDKRDQESMMKQQAEQKALYEKYGVSPTAGCLPLLIQMPILLALYRVISNIPAYVTSIFNRYQLIVDAVKNTSGFSEVIASEQFAELARSNGMSVDKYVFDGTTTNHLIDLFYRFDHNEWAAFQGLFPSVNIQNYIDDIMNVNSFLGGINLTEAPGFRLSIALIIPILAWFTQWLSSKLMMAVNAASSSAASGEKNSMNATMESTMKSMTTIMPVFSAVMCISIPAGLGVYWISSAAVRIVQQLGINSYMKRIDVDELIRKNKEKQQKRREKAGLPPIKENAAIKTSKAGGRLADSTVNERNQKSMPSRISGKDYNDIEQQADVKPGGIAAKARMVKDYNDKNTKK